MKRHVFCAALLAAFAAGAVESAQAIDVSKQPTQNMSCNAGVCTPTAPKAVLNVGDLTSMLANGDLTVQTGNGDNTSAGITIANGFSWTNSSRLTLTAKNNIVVKAPVTVAGDGALTITYAAGNPDGDLLFEKNGKIDFWDLNSNLIINGAEYVLVDSISALARAVHTNRFGHYALADDYDATGDRTYLRAPIRSTFRGVFEGLANQISNLNLNISPGVFWKNYEAGLFAEIGKHGAIRHLQLVAARMQISPNGNGSRDGLLVGLNRGLIDHSSVAGKVDTPDGIALELGGAAGVNAGDINDVRAKVNIAISGADGSSVGALVGYNGGNIESSFSDGLIRANSDGGQAIVAIGGLVGWNDKQVTNTFSLANIFDGHSNCCAMYVGGLVGVNDTSAEKSGQLITSYAAGSFEVRNKLCCSGGFVGFDGKAVFRTTYWDLDKGIANPRRGAGNVNNDPGITGLTDAQLKSGLPEGFDPNIWGQSPNINNGYPYLLANPPPK